MKRTDADYHVGNLFQSGNPLTGQRGTRLDHTWLNAVQEELASVIETAGIALDASDNTQLLQAIGLIGGVKAGTLTDALAIAGGPRAPAGTLIAVENHASPGDGGGFVGIIEAAGNADYPGGGQIRPISALDPRAFGAAPGQDSAAAVNGTLAANGRAEMSSGTYEVASPIALTNGMHLSGAGSRATYLRNTSATSALTIDGGAVNSKDFGVVVEDIRIQSSNYAGTRDAALYLKDLGFTTLRNMELIGHKTAALHAQAVVGLSTYDMQFKFSQVAERYDNPDPTSGNTVTLHLGAVRDINGIGIQSSGILRQYLDIAGVFQNNNTIFNRDGQGEERGFTMLSPWFENNGPGTVTLTENDLQYTGGQPHVVVLGPLTRPVMLSPYFAGDYTINGGTTPKLVDATVTPSTIIGSLHFTNQYPPHQHELSVRAAGTSLDQADTGTGNHGIRTDLPLVGSLETPDEAYPKAGVHQSLAIANAAGIIHGHSPEAVANRCHTPISHTAYAGSNRLYWPSVYRTALGFASAVILSPGQPDPYNGNTAVRVTGGYCGSSDIATSINGGKYMRVMAVVRAVAPGAEAYFHLHINGADVGTGFRKTQVLTLHDTRWRLLSWVQYLAPAVGKKYRLGFGAQSGEIDVARLCIFDGTDMYPPLDYGQYVDRPFTFDHGQVEVRGNSAPTTGTWRIGDRVRFGSPTAGGHMGAVCIAAGTPGVWKNYGDIAA